MNWKTAALMMVLTGFVFGIVGFGLSRLVLNSWRTIVLWATAILGPPFAVMYTVQAYVEEYVDKRLEEYEGEPTE